jgi:DNA (cytosine-5)-methyltransferase 1
MTAYYNEIDPFAATWLRELIADGLIAPGDVDERSIEDVAPDDLRPYTQHHFFAGIGGWSLALRLAGWPDDRPIFSGSPPCQPFSTAGKGAGFDDERHLWPAFFWIIQQRRPGVVIGEQVASADALRWWDVVATDLENSDYSCAAVDLCAAGIGAHHVRQRLFWVANANGSGRQWPRSAQSAGRQHQALSIRGEQNRGMANSNKNGRGEGRELEARADALERGIQAIRGESGVDPDARGNDGGGLGDSDSERRKKQRQPIADDPQLVGTELPSFWGDATWLPCADGRFRATKPGIFPLAHGVPNRVGTLRGAGNAIVPHVAAEFIKAYLTIESQC